jgi:hypothetical protein
VTAPISAFLVLLSVGAVAGCGSAVASDCANTSKTTAQLQIEIPAARAAGELVIRGDCQQFTCVQQANGGCVLWQGEISTERNAACQVTLYLDNQLVESARVTGAEACQTGTMRVVVGD